MASGLFRSTSAALRSEKSTHCALVNPFTILRLKRSTFSELPARKKSFSNQHLMLTVKAAVIEISKNQFVTTAMSQ